MRRDLPTLLIILLIGIACMICAAFYPEPYLFTEYDISDFGATKSPQGFDNTVSSAIFITVFILSGFIALAAVKGAENWGYKITSILFGLGLWGVALPTNLYHSYHRLGAIILFFSFWAFLFMTMHSNGQGKFLFIEISVINFIYMLYSFHIIQEDLTAIWQKVSFINTASAFVLYQLLRFKSTEQ